MYWLDSSRKFKTPGRKAFLMDSDNDVQNLPTIVADGVIQDENNVNNQKVVVGSVAYSIDSGNIFILNSQSVWKQKK